jgi:hypothetical protein
MIPRAMMGLRPVVFVPRTLVRTWGTRPLLYRRWKLMRSSFARVATVFGFTSCLVERRVVPGPLTTVFGFTSCPLERRVVPGPLTTVFGFTSCPLERRVVPGPLTTVFGFTSCLLERRVPHVRTSVRGTKTMFFERFHLIAHRGSLAA